MPPAALTAATAASMPSNSSGCPTTPFDRGGDAEPDRLTRRFGGGAPGRSAVDGSEAASVAAVVFAA